MLTVRIPCIRTGPATMTELECPLFLAPSANSLPPLLSAMPPTTITSPSNASSTIPLIPVTTLLPSPTHQLGFPHPHLLRISEASLTIDQLITNPTTTMKTQAPISKSRPSAFPSNALSPFFLCRNHIPARNALIVSKNPPSWICFRGAIRASMARGMGRGA